MRIMLTYEAVVYYSTSDWDCIQSAASRARGGRCAAWRLALPIPLLTRTPLGRHLKFMLSNLVHGAALPVAVAASKIMP